MTARYSEPCAGSSGGRANLAAPAYHALHSPEHSRRRLSLCYHSGFYRRGIFTAAGTYNRGCDVIFGCRSSVGKCTVGPIELVLDIFAACTNPRFVEATNSQPLAIRKNKGFSSVIDPEGYMLVNLDPARLASLIGHNDFGGCALKLSTRFLRLTRLRQRGQDGDH